jgi:hypothetical protein
MRPDSRHMSSGILNWWVAMWVGSCAALFFLGYVIFLSVRMSSLVNRMRSKTSPTKSGSRLPSQSFPNAYGANIYHHRSIR